MGREHVTQGLGLLVASLGLAVGLTSIARASELIVTNGNAVDVTTNTTSDGASVGIDHNLSSGNTDPNGTVTIESGAVWTINSVGTDTYGNLLPSLWLNSTFNEYSSATGTATVNVLSGGALVNGGATLIGANNWYPSHPTGAMDVASGATFTNQGQLTVDRGQLTIEGTVNNNAQNAFFGDASGNAGSALVTVNGPNATLNVTNSSVQVSYASGNAQLNIEEGGTVNSYWGMIGTSGATQTGSVTVQGDSGLGLTSTWNATDYISVGEYGAQGSLTVNDHGTVNMRRMFIGLLANPTDTPAGTGTVTVNSGGAITVTPGFLPATVEMWAGSTLDVSNGGQMLIGNGNVNFVTPGTIEVSNGGVLKGEGTVKGNVFVTGGGIVKPGHSPGTITVDGNLTVDPSSSTSGITIDIASATSYDVLNVTGTLDFGGGTINLNFINGYTPTQGDPVNLTPFTAGTLTGTFSGVSVTGLPAGQTASVDFSSLSSGQIAFTPVLAPEPASLALLMVAGTLLAVRRRGEERGL